MPEWSEKDMKKELKAVRDGIISQNKASLLYKIPKGTLNSRPHGKNKYNKAGAPTKLGLTTEFFSKHSKYNFKHEAALKYDQFGFKSD